jgi:hypothetical protein
MVMTPEERHKPRSLALIDDEQQWLRAVWGRQCVRSGDRQDADTYSGGKGSVGDYG